MTNGIRPMLFSEKRETKQKYQRWHVHGWERERGGNISASERVVPPVATARVLSACAPGELVTQATAHFCLNSAYVSTVHNALQKIETVEHLIWICRIRSENSGRTAQFIP